jgi:hypothetical protein
MVVETRHGMPYTTSRKEGKEGGKMLPIEVIGVLGLLYIFFMVGTVKAVLAKRAVHRKAKVKPKPKPVIKDLAPQTVKRTV